MRIEEHDKSHIVQLEDGSRWRIWPGDLAKTLNWTPDTKLTVVAVDDPMCSHALVDEQGVQVLVTDAGETWRVGDVAHAMKP